MIWGGTFVGVGAGVATAEREGVNRRAGGGVRAISDFLGKWVKQYDYYRMDQ
mgnify:CR=1 FL=1